MCLNQVEVKHVASITEDDVTCDFMAGGEEQWYLFACQLCFKSGNRTSDPLIKNSFRIVNNLLCCIKHQLTSPCIDKHLSLPSIESNGVLM